MRAFVDVANGGKPHRCYSPGDDRFFEADSLAELRDFSEVYIDASLFPGVLAEAGELLKAGARVYYFTRPWWWKRLRKRFKDELRGRFGRVKTDYGDAWILYRVYCIGLEKGNLHKWFKPIMMVDVVLRPLLGRETMLSRMVQRMRSAGFEDIAEDVEKTLRKVREEIVSKGLSLIPRLRDAAMDLGVGDSLETMTSLVGLTTYMEPRSYHQALRYMGLYKAKKKNKKKYSGKAGRYLFMLATHVVRREEDRFPPRLRDQRRLLRRLVRLLKDVKGG